MTLISLRSMRTGLPVGPAALASAFALALAWAGIAGAATYYVDIQNPAASPAGPGTEAMPYSSISAAVAAHKEPGVTILVKPGLYREQVTVPVSGTPDAPYVIRAEGPGVLIDGADALGAEYLWSQPGPGPVAGPGQPQAVDYAWLASGVDWPVQQVFVNGRRLSRSTGSPELLPSDAFTWVQGEGLYVNLEGGNPGRQEILVGHRANAFRMSGKSWVTIDGFEITRTEDASISLQVGCADVVVSNNRVTFSNTYGIRAANCQRVRIENNVVSDGEYHGIGLTGGSSGCVVHGNESFANADPLVRRANGIYLFGSPNNIIEANGTHDNQDSGIQLDAGSNYCLVYNNRSYLNGDHGFDHLDATNTTHVHNVAYGNHKDGFSIEGNSPGTMLYNCIATDNGLTSGEYDLWVNGPSSVGFRSDYNIFWNSTDQYPIKYVSTKFSRLVDYQAASGQDLHSIQANPLFVDPRQGDFLPLSGSPAIDAGTSALSNWPATDEDGNTRYDDPSTPNSGTGPVPYADIGAEEFVMLADPAPVQMPIPNASIDDRDPDLLAGQPAGTEIHLALSAGFPNPSRGPVDFALDLPQASRVEWAVYDVQGRVIWSESRALGAGRSQLRWDGTGARGEPAADGIYLVRARVDGTQLTRRVVRF